MAGKRRRQPNYTPEFMEKAVDLTLASVLPDKHVANLLGVNPSTLATWKSKRINSVGPQPQETLSLEVEDDGDGSTEPDKQSSAVATDKTPEAAAEKLCEDDEISPVLNDLYALKQGEMERLIKENSRLRNERDVLQEAIIILAGCYLRS